MTRGHTAISPMIKVPQDISANWVDVGGRYSSFGFNVIGLYLKLTINDSQDFRVRIIANTSADDTTEYNLPINLITSEKTYITDAFVEIDADSDKDILLFFDIESVVPYFKVQIQGGFVGATPATLDEISYCLGVK